MVATSKCSPHEKLFVGVFHESILLTLRGDRCRAGRNGQMHCSVVTGYGPKRPCKDRRDNVGKGHFPAGARSNLQGPDEIGTTEVVRRVLV